MKILLVLFLLAAGLLNACCSKPHHDEPPYPTNISGWEGTRDNNGKIHRKFVLRKGEVTDNGEIQIKVVDIIPPEPCAEVGTFQRQARAKIQFIRLSDNRILSEDIYPEHGGSFIPYKEDDSTSPTKLVLTGLDIAAIVTLGINLKEQWICFQLN